MTSQLSMRRKRGRKHRARARTRTRTRTKSSRTKRKGRRDLYKESFSISNLTYKRKIKNNLQEGDVQHTVF